MNRPTTQLGRRRAIVMAILFAATTFAVDAAPVALPGPLAEALGPKPVQAGYCASNAAFQGRLTSSSASTAAVARTTSSTVFGYISNVTAAWSCTLYYRYSGITWNTSASVGRFQWGNLINSSSVACNFVVGSTDYLKGNSTADCPDFDAEYALSATLDAERVYQRDINHDSIGDFSFVHTDCASYYGANPLITGQSYSTGNTANRPNAGNCDPIGTDDTNTNQTITYDATNPTAAVTDPASGSASKIKVLTKAVTFNPSDNVAGFGGTFLWQLQRQIAPISSPGSCGTFANDPAAGNLVTGTAQTSQTSAAQTLVAAKCYRWTLTARDQNGNGPVVSTTPGTLLVDTVAPSTDFSAPNEGTTSTQNTTAYTIAWTETELDSGITSRSLQRQRVSSATSACGGTFTDDGSAVTTTSPVGPQTLTTGYCYRWIQTLTDGSTNSSAKTSGIIFVDTAGPTTDFSTPNEGTTALQTGTSYSVAWTETAGSGTVTGRSLQREKGAITTANVCTGVTWASDGSADTGASPRNPAGVLSGGNCYRWAQTLTNSGGKSSTTYSGSVLVDTTGPSGTITAPAANQPVGGDVDITGGATDAHSFKEYQLEYGAGATPGSWTTIGSIATTQVAATGRLGTWSTAALNGTYTIRLTVRENAGGTASVTTRTVVVENTGRGTEAYITRVPFDLGGGYNLDVGVANGEARLSRDLFSIPSYGPPQALGLTYSSLEASADGRFGVGWSSNLTQYLTFDATDLIVWHRADGGRVPFGRVASNWTPLAGNFETLAINTGTHEVTITATDRSALVFDDAGAGRLKRLENRFGNALTLAWSASSATATDASGRVTTLTIDSGNNRITAASDSAGRGWTFTYTGTAGASDLTKITDPTSGETALAYSSHKLTSVTRTRHRLVGADETIVWAIGYTATLATSVTDPISTNASTFTYNAGSTDVGLLKNDTGPVRNTWTYALDGSGRVTSATDAEGFSTTSVYDAASNVTTLVRPVGTLAAPDSSTTTSTYDGSGNLLTEVHDLDASHTVRTVSTYNATNDLLSRTEAEGTAIEYVTTYTYDGSGQLTRVNVNCTTSGTAVPADPWTCTGAGTQDIATNLITDYAYTANHQLEFEQDALGRITKHAYDSHGNETSTIRNCTTSGTTPPGTFSTCTGAGTANVQTNVVSTTTYTTAGLPLKTTDPVGNETTYTYDGLGRQLTEIVPGDGTSIPVLTRTTTYDELSNVLTEADSWDPIGPDTTVTRTTSHVYDKANRETSASDPAGIATSSTYDAAGGAITTTSAGVVTTRTFDGRGRPLTETIGTESTTHEYDGQGNDVRSISAEGKTTGRAFNDVGWLVTETADPDDLAVQTLHDYDLLGREVKVTDPQLRETTRTYDRIGRIIETQTDGLSTKSVHDRVGNTLTVKGPDGVVSATIVDPLDRPTSSIGSCTNSGTTVPADFVLCTGGGTANATTNLTTATWYNAAGTPQAVRDPKGISTRTIVNGRNLAKTSIANCTDSGTTPTSNPPACVGAGTNNATTNVSTTITYDGQGATVGSIVAVGTGAEATTETAYDAAGKVKAVRDPMGTITRSLYDGSGRPSRTIVNCTDSGTTIPTDWVNCAGTGTANGTFNLSTTYGYDSLGNQTSVVAPNGRETRTTYDLDNRVSSRTDNYVDGVPGTTDDLVTTLFYDAAGRQVGTLSPSSSGSVVVATRVVYNADGTVASEIRGCTDSGTTVPENAGTCGGAGTKNAETNVSTSYTYDNRANRVTMTAPDPAATSGTSTATVTTQYAYDAADRLCRVVENATGSTNLQTLADPCSTATQTGGTTTTNVSTRYTHDAAANLATMVDAAGHTTTYAYDKAGQMTGLTDALGGSVAWAYNDLGQRTSQTSRGDATPLTPTVSWTYDGAGRVLTRTHETAPSTDVTAPTTPTGLTATAAGPNRVNLAWTASTDAVGIVRYTISRGGAVLSQVAGGSTSFSDFSVAPATAYAYTLTAADAAGNTSSATSAANATTPTIYPDQVVADGPVAYWRLGESSGSFVDSLTGNDATAVGSPTRHVANASLATDDGSISTTSVSNYATVADGTDVDLSDQFSIEFWATRDADTATFEVAISKGTAAYNVGIADGLGSALDDKLFLGKPGTAILFRTSNNVPADGTWHHYVITRNGTGSGNTHIYVDGVDDTVAVDTSTALTNNSNALHLGHDQDPGNTATWNGKIDEVALFKTILTSTQVAVHYAARNTTISADVTAPTTPTGLTATAAGPNRVNLAWTASTDAIGVQGYRIYRGGSLVATAGSTTFVDVGLTASTLYSYTVAAIDGAANASSQTSAQTATTAASGGDTTAPSTPTGLTVTAAGSTAIGLSWTASTDAVAVQGYVIARGGSDIATVGSTSWTDPGRSAATNYSYTVRAFDPAANTSSASSSANATTGAASVTTTYTYDGNGNKLTATDGTLTITATFDRLNRVLTVDDEDAGSTADTTYSYDLTSPSWTDPTGTFGVTLDKFDRATALNDPVNGTDFTWAYRADGQPSTFAQPNGNTTALDYDALGHLVSKHTTASGPTNRAIYDWTQNRAGQTLTEASTITGDPDNGTLTYAYDALGRLTGSTVSATTTAYAWDKVPNRTSVQVGAGTAATTTYDAANRPTSGASPTAAYASDADGRLLARPGQTLGWDQLGRLTSVKNASGTTTLATYTYDPLDRLRTADDGVNRIRFRYVGLTTSAAQWLDDLAGTVTRSIGTGWSGERLLDWTGSGSNIRIYGENAHHDVTWLGSSTGAVSQALRYDPWGTPRSTPPVGYSPFRLQGSWYDAATDLSWVVTRWYAPLLGRFVSEDSVLGEPIDPPSRHLYAYGTGDPAGRWDPDGMAAYKPGYVYWKLYSESLADKTALLYTVLGLGGTVVCVGIGTVFILGGAGCTVATTAITFYGSTLRVHKVLLYRRWYSTNPGHGVWWTTRAGYQFQETKKNGESYFRYWYYPEYSSSSEYRFGSEPTELQEWKECYQRGTSCGYHTRSWSTYGFRHYVGRDWPRYVST